MKQEFPQSTGAINPKMMELFGVSQPMLAINAYADSAAIGANYVPMLRNQRQVPGRLMARYGCTDLFDSGMVSIPVHTTVLGSYFGPEGKFFALGSASHGTAVYKWTGTDLEEITDAAHPRYGNTRFTSGTAPVTFTVVKEGVQRGAMSYFSEPEDTYLVWQNGEELPRIANCDDTLMTGSGHHEVAIINPLTAPNRADCAAYPSVESYLSINATGGSIVDSGATVTSSIPTNDFGKYIDIQFLTTAVAGNYATYTAPSATAALSANTSQLHLVYDTVDPTFWSRVNVILTYTDASSEIIHRGASVESQPVIGECVGSIKGQSVINQVVFSLTHAYNSGGDHISRSNKAVASVRIEWRDSVSPSKTQRIRIYGIAFTGGIEYGAEFMASYFCGCPAASNGTGGNVFTYSARGGSRAESAGIVCKTGRAPTLKDIGGTAMEVRMAEQAGFRYSYVVTAPYATPSTSLPVTAIFIYARWSNRDTFEHTSAPPNAIAGNSWQPYDPDKKLASVTLYDEQGFSRVAPDGSHDVLPIGSVMHFGGSRTVVGNSRDTTADTSVGRIAVSEYGYPFRFRATTRIQGSLVDPSSGFEDQLPPSESVVAIVEPVQSSIGGNLLLVFSGTNCYQYDTRPSDGTQRLRWALPFGTINKQTATRYYSDVYWVDQDYVVRSLQSAYNPISLGTVEPILDAIDRTKPICCGVSKNLLYIAYGSGTAMNMLVYSFTLGQWISVDTIAGVQPNAMFNVTDSGEQQFLLADTSRRCILLNDQSADGDLGGTGIAFEVQFQDVRAPIDGNIILGEVAVRADAQDATITVTRTVDGNSETGTINLAGTGVTWKLDNDSGNVASKSGENGSVKISGTVDPGTAFYQVLAGIGVQPGGPER